MKSKSGRPKICAPARSGAGRRSWNEEERSAGPPSGFSFVLPAARRSIHGCCDFTFPHKHMQSSPPHEPRPGPKRSQPTMRNEACLGCRPTVVSDLGISSADGTYFERPFGCAQSSFRRRVCKAARDRGLRSRPRAQSRPPPTVTTAHDQPSTGGDNSY
jgi:hypothetical protein